MSCSRQCVRSLDRDTELRTRLVKGKHVRREGDTAPQDAVQSGRCKLEPFTSLVSGHGKEKMAIAWSVSTGVSRPHPMWSPPRLPQSTGCSHGHVLYWLQWTRWSRVSSQTLLAVFRILRGNRCCAAVCLGSMYDTRTFHTHRHRHTHSHP